MNRTVELTLIILVLQILSLSQFDFYEGKWIYSITLPIIREKTSTSLFISLVILYEIMTTTKENELVLIGEKISKLVNSPKLTLSSQLTYMNLAYNSLTNLPETFFIQCPLLVKLNLTGNRLVVIPGSIARMRQLQWLNLSFNAIEESTLFWQL